MSLTKYSETLQQHEGFKPGIGIILNLQQNYSCYVTLSEAVTRTEAAMPRSKQQRAEFESIPAHSVQSGQEGDFRQAFLLRSTGHLPYNNNHPICLKW